MKKNNLEISFVQIRWLIDNFSLSYVFKNCRERRKNVISIVVGSKGKKTNKNWKEKRKHIITMTNFKGTRNSRSDEMNFFYHCVLKTTKKGRRRKKKREKKSFRQRIEGQNWEFETFSSRDFWSKILSNQNYGWEMRILPFLHDKRLRKFHKTFWHFDIQKMKWFSLETSCWLSIVDLSNAIYIKIAMWNYFFNLVFIVFHVLSCCRMCLMPKISPWTPISLFFLLKLKENSKKKRTTTWNEMQLHKNMPCLCSRFNSFHFEA